MANPSSPVPGATPEPDTGATPTTAPGAMPAAMTLEQALAALADREAVLAATRKESIAHRTKLSAFEKAQAEAEALKLDETQKAAKRAEVAEAKAKEYQDRLMAAQVKLAAQSLGFANPEIAAKLITVDGDATDDDIQKALAALAKSDPYLVSGAPVPPSSNGPTNPSRAQVGLPIYTAAQLSDTNFYIAHEADIKAAMRDGRIRE